MILMALQAYHLFSPRPDPERYNKAEARSPDGEWRLVTDRVDYQISLGGATIIYEISLISNIDP